MLALPKKWKNYELFKQDELKGSMQYKNFFEYTAQIQINNSEPYNIKYKISWGNSRYELSQNENVLGQMRMNLNWKNDVLITLPDAPEFKIVSKSGLRQRYFLENQNTGEQFEIKRKYNWRKMSYAYEFADSNAAQYELLCLMSVYAVNNMDQKLLGILAVSIPLIEILINGI
jgi:hypothetical protein